MIARRKEDRLRQVARWLADKYPCAYPVRLTLSRAKALKDHYGVTARSGRKFWIILNLRYPLHLLTQTLLHEWAHARAWRHESVERRRLRDHDAEWGLAYSEIYGHYMEAGGYEESGEY